MHVNVYKASLFKLLRAAAAFFNLFAESPVEKVFIHRSPNDMKDNRRS